ncbi:MAG: hypothetical protein NC210_01425 [[Clostridium] fimetarium]|nr:hypothetical protein [Alistipes timonensis]MCM1405065.1 hypothetical protein [[Clostridium] fimetarium]
MTQTMIVMNVPFLTWCVIVFGVIAIILCRVGRHVYLEHKGSARRTPLFSIGSEREEFFIPGDKPVYSNEDDDDAYDD